MDKVKYIVLSGLAVIALSPAMAFAQVTKLTFEGLQDQEEILEFYNGGTGSLGSTGPDLGISFAPGALALIDADAGGSGNFANEPSADTIAFFLNAGSLVMNVPAGFDTGFSFFYSAFEAASVTVYDAVDGTGNVLGTVDLVAQYNDNSCTGDPTGDACNWTPIGVDFAGTARSVDFSGVAGAVGFDDITFGTSDPTTPSNNATFSVTKTFTNGDTGDVEVSLTCNGGLPLQQSFTISGDGPGVTFVVTNLPDAGADCEVTESGGSDGYTADLSACSWTGVTGGSYSCTVANIPEPTSVAVNTTVDGEDDPAIDTSFTTTIVCTNVSADTGSVFGTVTETDTTGMFEADWYAAPGETAECTATMVPNER